MRRIMSMILCLAALLTLAGCETRKVDLEGVPTFYYLRGEITYGSQNSVIDSEQLLTAGGSSDLDYLLALYFAGPTDDRLRSPYPIGTEVLNFERSGTDFLLTMNSAFAKLEGIALTKACACLAITVFGIVDVESVTIQAEDDRGDVTQTIQLNRDSLVLQDDAPLVP